MPATIHQEVDDLIAGLRFDQQESLLRELLLVLATDASEYGSDEKSLNDYRVETIEQLIDLRGQYEQMAGEQMDLWDREARVYARSEYRERTAERRAA
ncbi:hypothetical protein DFLDMN_001521 [Cupriavidus sp. H19C3]|uniref:hypothetical protein n=1 Tax=Cupriavidus sp. H19C3 TaxID=3241603 RepID=UPI003BF89FCF